MHWQVAGQCVCRQGVGTSLKREAKEHKRAVFLGVPMGTTRHRWAALWTEGSQNEHTGHA